MCKAPGKGAPIDLHRKAFNAAKADPMKRALGITHGKKRTGKTTAGGALRSAFGAAASDRGGMEP
jgi:hypothetical protein